MSVEATATMIAFPGRRMLGNARAWAQEIAALPPSKARKRHGVAVWVVRNHFEAVGVPLDEAAAEARAYTRLLDAEIARLRHSCSPLNPATGRTGS